MFEYATRPPQPYDQVEREEAERRKIPRRGAWEIESGLRASAHFGTTAEYRALARLLADDMYEHLTGTEVDEGHRRAQRYAVKEAFRATRSEQMAANEKVQNVMKAYGVEKEEAYALIDKGLPEVPKPRKVAFKAVEMSEEEVEALRLVAEAEAAHKRREEEERLAKELEEEGKRREAAEAEARAEAEAEREAEKKAELKEVPLTKAQKRRLKVRKNKEVTEDEAFAEMERYNALKLVEVEKKREQDSWKAFVRHAKRDIEGLERKVASLDDVMDRIKGTLREIAKGKTPIIVFETEDGIIEEVVMTEARAVEELNRREAEKSRVEASLRERRDQLKMFEAKLTGKGKSKDLANYLGQVAIHKKFLERLEEELADAARDRNFALFERLKSEQNAMRAELMKFKREVQNRREGYGRQHKDFLYSRPDLTKAEKARERSAHYRKVKQAAEGAYMTRKGTTRAYAYFDKEGKEAATGELRKVELTPEDIAREEARGLKPKKDSIRRPYVGKVMKQRFLSAIGKSEEEARKELNAAKRLYKAGGVSWEDVVARYSK